ncbi:MAG: hypothetical protein EHM55_19645 [Acidobacteria bacterium]|nr:MAG: hypothetical protein EHM55_19645 [Acidobacteriota bacterium]
MNGHRSQSIEEPRFIANWPPFVKKDLQRAPHGDPPADEKTLAQDFANLPFRQLMGDEVADANRHCKKREADEQARTANAEQLAQLLSGRIRAMTEILADCVAQNDWLFGQACRAIQIHQQRKGRVGRHFTRPADDEVFRVGIQVFFPKR